MDDRKPADPVSLEQALLNLRAAKKQAADRSAELAPELEMLRRQQAELDALPQHERRKVLDDAGLRHVSAAPKPITPLSGRGAVKAEIPRTLTGVRSCPPPRPERIAPAWNYWRILDRVEEWEVAALSLNIEPRGMSFRSDKEASAFEARLRIVESLPDSVKSLDGVSLAAFAAWAVMQQLDDLPPELVAMAQQHMPTPTPQPLPMISAPEWSALVQQDDEAKQDPAYKAAYDQARSLYDEYDELRAMQNKGEKSRKRLEELADAVRELEKTATSGAAERNGASVPVAIPADVARKPRTRIDGLALAMRAGIVAYRVKYRTDPTARALFDWLTANDETGKIEEFDADNDRLTWKRSDGGLSDTTFKSFQARFTNLTRK